MSHADSRFEPIHDRFRPISLERIQEVETKLRASLPRAYVDFLSRYGGCGFSGDANVVFEGGRFPVFTFFDDQKLLSKLAFYEDLAAESKLAIADDMEGNIYVLDALAGPVHFLDFSVNPPVGTKVAETFERFLASIKVEPFR
jgi:hypothetical protein